MMFFFFPRIYKFCNENPVAEEKDYWSAQKNKKTLTRTWKKEAPMQKKQSHENRKPL